MRIMSEAPDVILHAGDVGSHRFLDDLAEIAPVMAVRGNMDSRNHGLPDGISLQLEGAEGPLLGIYLTHIGVHATRLLRDARNRAEKHGAALVVCGHSHVPLIAYDGALAIFNPGSCGPQRFNLPIVFGVIDLGPEGLTMRHVDCETGQRWLP